MTSRRRLAATEVHKVNLVLRMHCPAGHFVGPIVRRPGWPPPMFGPPLERLDGPNGETTVRVVCPICLSDGKRIDSQMRLDRIVAMLDELQATYKPGTDTPNERDVTMP